MKRKFTTIIMSIVTMLNIGVLGIFVLIFMGEFELVENAIEPEAFKTVISDNSNTVEKNTGTEQVQTPPITNNPLAEIRDENNKNTVDYSSVQVDKYFYNQLEEPSKTIYKAFEANYENMKTGIYRVELGDTFTSILQKENGQKILGDYYQSAFEAYNYDNPDVFFISANKMYLNVETTTRGNKKTYNVYIDSGKESNYFTDEFSSKEEIDAAINKINKVKSEIFLNKTGDIYQDIKMVHDYLIDNLEYDTTLSKENIYDMYGALVNKVAVCEGYAKTFKYIMDEMKIPCVLVIGEGTNSQGETEKHAWNYVQINGNWYAIDVTWDDPVVSGGGRASRESRYKYFLKGSNTFKQDHIPNGQFIQDGKVFEYPVISENDY